jgi:uncharacterized protein with von Willebrand factor type A (vWA) domain
VDRHRRHFTVWATTGIIPQGVRIGGKSGKHGRAIKVWEKREFAQPTTTRSELGTRNIKVALRRLRRFAREGNDLEELDLLDAIRAKAPPTQGWLDIHMRPGAPQRT